MKNVKILFASLLTLATTVNMEAQVTEDYDSKNFIVRGVEMYQDEDYNGAIKEFSQIHQNDTNYVKATLYSMYAAEEIENDSLVLDLVEKILVLPKNEYTHTALLYKAESLHNLEKLDDAEKIYKHGLKDYPLMNRFYYKYSNFLFDTKRYKEAHDIAVKSIKINPYDSDCHFMMGKLAVKQGKLIPAMLAYQFYLLLDHSSSKAWDVVNELEALAKIENEFEDAITIEGLTELDNFEELEALVRSKAALSDGYKSKTKIKFNITKQLQLISEKIEVNEGDKGFYMSFYAPILKKQFELGHYRTYAYYILSGLGVKSVDSWINKHSKDKDAYTAWIAQYIEDNFSNYEAELNGEMVKAKRYYTRSLKLGAIGNVDSEDNNIGYWNYFYSTGIVRAEGAYKKGNKDGVWKYYDIAGKIEDMKTTADGELSGTRITYYSNESPESKLNYEKSLLEGKQYTYYATGVMSAEYDYENDKRVNQEKKYYENGKLNYSIGIKEGEYEGEYLKYYKTGHLKQKSTFKEGNKEGVSKVFYNFPEGVLYEEVSYKEGNPVGEYKSYYRDGKIKETGEYDADGMLTGVWKEYYKDGKTESEKSYSKGKLNGAIKYYSANGIINEHFEYKNDVLVSYKAFDEEGKAFFEEEKYSKNDYQLEIYHSNGNLRRKGRVLKGENEGVWEDYDVNGMLTKRVNYNNGTLDGEYTKFYAASGKVKSVMIYDDGKTDGIYKEYYPSGKLYREGAYVDDDLVGSWIVYYPDGKVKSSYYYKDGILDGWQSYYCVNGKLDTEEYEELGYLSKIYAYDTLNKVYKKIVLDKGTGDYLLPYTSGNKYLDFTFKNDLKEGKYLIYFPNGKLRLEKNYVNNNVEGEQKSYYITGTPNGVKNYLNGDLHGKVTRYQLNGKKYSEHTYEYGEKQGKYQFYYDNGKLEFEGNYEDDNLEGEHIMYDVITGEVALKRIYHNGYLTAYTYKDKTGKYLPLIPVKNETVHLKSYYPNGKLSVEFTMKNGEYHGKRTEYYMSGQLKEETEYEWGEVVGVHKKYHTNGTVKLETTYKDDEAIGESTQYFDNGQVKVKGYYVNGYLHGWRTFYDQSGKVNASYLYYNGEIIEVK